jgi:hypothetical protein
LPPGCTVTKKKPAIAPWTEGALTIFQRGDYFHVRGTIRKAGRSARVREALGVVAAGQNKKAAEVEARRIEATVAAELGGGKRLSIATNANNFLTRSAADPVGPRDAAIIQELTRHFGTRILWDIPPHEFVAFVDDRQRRNKPESRERYLNTVCAFLNVAISGGQYPAMPPFIRNQKARNPATRAKRPVQQFREDLLADIIDAAHPTIGVQLTVEWVAGSRVSSLLQGCALGDLDLAPGRMTLTLRDTKNSDDVPVALPEELRPTFANYLGWRNQQVRAGKIRAGSDQPLFLHYKGRPYKPNDGAWGTQNKTGFNAARRRAIKVVEARYDAKIAAMEAAGDMAEVDRLRRFKADDVSLLGRITQHWLRHKFATDVGRQDPVAAMRQGGWRDSRSLAGYLIEDAEYQRALIEQRGAPGTNLTQRETKDGSK